MSATVCAKCVENATFTCFEGRDEYLGSVCCARLSGTFRSSLLTNKVLEHGSAVCNFLFLLKIRELRLWMMIKEDQLRI